MERLGLIKDGVAVSAAPVLQPDLPHTVEDFFTHYMPDRESQAILCPANELEGRRWRTYDARSVTCPNCLAAMTVQGLTADHNNGPDVSAEVQKCTPKESGVVESGKQEPETVNPVTVDDWPEQQAEFFKSTNH
jgi:hypothetical protein